MTTGATLHVHELKGCQPDVLGLYLKALGILRLVSEQVDPDARGFWRDEAFVLVTRLARDELVEFFTRDYCPTSLTTPWNAASGFFRTWDPKKEALRGSKNARARDAVLEHGNPRFDELRRVATVIDSALQRIATERDVATLERRGDYLIVPVPGETGSLLPTLDKESDKARIQRVCATEISSNPFFRSAIVDMGEEFEYPALWGTGGNDGAIDFTGRFFENLKHCLIDLSPNASRQLATHMLFGSPTRDLLSGAAGKVGQLMPGGAGGANSVTGFGSQSDTRLNPWDFILMLEGGVLFASSATERLKGRSARRVAAPFAVEARAAGYASAGAGDESVRGEQWMPLWRQPWTLTAVRSVLAEGRCQVGVRASRDPVDLARSIARLGVARGIEAFERFGYIERNGQSNLAVPLGRWPVVPRPDAELLDDLDGWLGRLHRATRGDRAPKSLTSAERRLDDAILAAVSHDTEPRRWQEVLLALAAVEDCLVHSSGFTGSKRLAPIPPLRPGWVRSVRDDSPEFRLALALAGACRPPTRPLDGSGGGRDPLRAHKGARGRDGLRRHWLPLDPFGRAFVIREKRLAPDPAVVCHGRDPVADLVALVSRRVIEASQRGIRHVAIAPSKGCAARGDDLGRFVAGQVDIHRCVRLARALMAVDWSEWVKGHGDRPPGGEPPGDLWVAVRLAHLPAPLEDGRSIPLDPAILRSLAGGDAPGAIRMAVRRLASSGVRPGFAGGALSTRQARLVAASLAFPIHARDAQRWALRLNPHNTSEPSRGASS